MQKLLELLDMIAGENLASIHFEKTISPGYRKLPGYDLPKIDNTTPFLHIDIEREIFPFLPPIKLHFYIELP